MITHAAGRLLPELGQRLPAPQEAQEEHLRGAVAAYFEQGPSGGAQAAPDQESAAAAKPQALDLEGLPLAAASRFLATDVRMLLRETAARQVAPPDWLQGSMYRVLRGPRFLATDVRMLLRETAARQVATPDWLKGRCRLLGGFPLLWVFPADGSPLLATCWAQSNLT